MHAKSQLIWAIRLARAMGVVRKLTTHLILGGNLYGLATEFYVVKNNHLFGALNWAQNSAKLRCTFDSHSQQRILDFLYGNNLR